MHKRLKKAPWYSIVIMKCGERTGCNCASLYVWEARLAAVALTDQLVHQRIAHEKYLEFAADLETEVRAI